MANYNPNESEKQEAPARPAHTVLLDRAAAAAIRWVSKAREKGGTRPQLSGLYIDGAMVACDGFRMHATPVPYVLPDELHGKTVDFGKVTATTDVAEAQEVADGYPDYNQIIPVNEPDFEAWVDPKYLIDALAGMTSTKQRRVRITFTNHYDKHNGELFQRVQVYGEGPDGRPAYAIVGGWTKPSGGEYRWVPKRAAGNPGKEDPK